MDIECHADPGADPCYHQNLINCFALPKNIPL